MAQKQGGGFGIQGWPGEAGWVPQSYCSEPKALVLKKINSISHLLLALENKRYMETTFDPCEEDSSNGAKIWSVLGVNLVSHSVPGTWKILNKYLLNEC